MFPGDQNIEITKDPLFNVEVLKDAHVTKFVHPDGRVMVALINNGVLEIYSNHPIEAKTM